MYIAGSPLQAEAISLEAAVKCVSSKGYTNCYFQTDCQFFVDAVMGSQPPIATDWKAFSEVFNIWKIFQITTGFKCMYVPRSQTALADYLARKGRVEGWDYTGFSFPIFKP